ELCPERRHDRERQAPHRRRGQGEQGEPLFESGHAGKIYQRKSRIKRRPDGSGDLVLEKRLPLRQAAGGWASRRRASAASRTPTTSSRSRWSPPATATAARL